MGVAGTGVGEGPSVGGGPGVSATTVLTSAVISIGVEIPLPEGEAAHALRNSARVKANSFFIEASLYSRTDTENNLFPSSQYSKEYRAGLLIKTKVDVQ